MAVYDLFAQYYDAVTGESSTETSFIDSVVKRAHPRPVTLLEVACGTGGVIASLASRYQVTGLDISPGMLAVARRKLPEGTPLHVADMSCFELSVKFDVIVCVYYGINHLLGFPAWTSFFDCVNRHLADDGVFVFDTFTIDDLEEMASGPEIVQQLGENSLRIRVQKSGEEVFDWNVELLEPRPDGRRPLLTGVVRTASFPLERTAAALGERFANVTIIQSDGGVGGGSEDRIWFVCTGPRPTA